MKTPKHMYISKATGIEYYISPLEGDSYHSGFRVNSKPQGEDRTVNEFIIEPELLPILAELHYEDLGWGASLTDGEDE
jgi:hypothetical protein